MFLTDVVDVMSDMETAKLYLQLYEATLRGDWQKLEVYFKRDPFLLYASISGSREIRSVAPQTLK